MRSIAGTPASRNGEWSSKIRAPVPGGKTRADAHRAGRGAQPRPEPPVRAALAHQAQVAVADVVEQDELRATSPRVGPLVGARAAQAPPQEVAVAGRLLAVEEHEAHLAGARRARRVPQRPRELEDDGGARGAVVGSRHARGGVDRVEVGGDDDGRAPPRQRPHDVAQRVGAVGPGTAS